MGLCAFNGLGKTPASPTGFLNFGQTLHTIFDATCHSSSIFYEGRTPSWKAPSLSQWG
jgi:hypothetical protein